MSHRYSNNALTILRDLAILDRYRRASDRPDGDEFSVTAGNVSLLEAFLSRFLNDFLDQDQEMMRNGQEPLEIHLESGAGASRVTPSALVSALFGKTFLELEAPENLERFAAPVWLVLLFAPFPFILHFFRGEFRGGIADVNLRPAAEEGDLTIAWDRDRRGLVIKLEFETEGTEITGVADIAGDVEGDITKLEVSVVLKPALEAQRVLWEAEVLVDVEAVSSIPTMSDDELQNKVSDGLTKTLTKMLKTDVVQILGSAFGVVPLRPVPESPASLSDQALAATLNNVFGLDVPERLQDADQAQLFALLIRDGLNQSIYEAALLPSNLRHILPPFQEFSDSLDLADLSDSERRRLFAKFARDHMELSHLVNRTDAYTEAEIEVDEISGDTRLVTEHEALTGVPDQPGIVCMRYLVSLDAISFFSPDARGSTRVECTVCVWHPLLAEDEDVVVDSEVAELDKFETSSRIVLGQAGLNLSTTCFLEWGGKMRLKGKVDANVLGGTDEFEHDIDITPDAGLFNGGHETVTGQFTPLEDPEDPDSGKYTIHYRIQQLPYARAYDWVRVEFDRIQLPRISASQFPQGVSLLIEGFVNRDLNEDTAETAPFRREFFNNFTQSINLSDWVYDVIYPQDDIGSELSIELRAVLINNANNEQTVFSASRVIPRFANEQREAVSADSLIEASEEGAVTEWGIPAGLPAHAFVMTDDHEQLRVTVSLRNERLDADEVPPDFSAKTFDIEVPSVRIENDTDHGLSGVGEIRFEFDVRLTPQAQGENDLPIDYPGGRTRVLEAEDPVDLELPGPPRVTVKARPGDELEIEVSGRDFDWPPIDPHDRMGKATLRVTVPEGDDLDHRVAGLFSERSSTRDFEARIRITTTSRPPAPRFWFHDLAEDMTLLEDVPVGTVVTLEYADLVEWTTSGRLAKSVDNGENWSEEAVLDPDDPADTFDVTVTETALYRLEVTNVAGTSSSRILKVTVA